MLATSDFPVAEALELLTRHDLEAALLVPTPTGMEKSIFDATADIREYLQECGYHDYSMQAQGGEAKVVRDAFFVQPEKIVPTVVSLYRPPTKKGDPRIWLGRATREQARPGNLLALLIIDGTLYILNMSDASVRRSLDDKGSPFSRALRAASRSENPAVSELLEMLRDVAQRGYIRTLRPGATGIGMTLETMLGISANSSQSPDFKGIEIKAKRGGKNSNRTSLFSQVPAWKLSPVGSAMELLERRGYDRDGRLQLYHELNACKPNSIGLMLKVEEEQDWLKQVHVDSETSKVTHDATWQMQKLRDRLANKHRETFWVHARCRGKGPEEEFLYHSVEHTKGPKVRNLEALIETGVITMDYTLSKISKTRARDHGYLFKIHSSNLGALFPPAQRHALEGPPDHRRKEKDLPVGPRPGQVVQPARAPLPVAIQGSLDLREGRGGSPPPADDSDRGRGLLSRIRRSLPGLGKPGSGK